MELEQAITVILADGRYQGRDRDWINHQLDRAMVNADGATFQGVLDREFGIGVDAGRAIDQAKGEILHDIGARVYRAEAIQCFSDLHDYVDANEYGGATDDGNINNVSITGIAFWAEVQDALNTWLVERNHELKAYKHCPLCRRNIETFGGKCRICDTTIS